MSKMGWLHRYVLIVDLIRNNRYISLEDLIVQLQKSLKDVDGAAISKRTVQRDMKDLDTNVISIKYSKINKGYFIPSDEVSELEEMLRAMDLLREKHLNDCKLQVNV